MSISPSSLILSDMAGYGTPQVSVVMSSGVLPIVGILVSDAP